MRLMRIGGLGDERPIVAVGNETYVDVSDVVTDCDSAFFAAGFDRLTVTVAERVDAGLARRFADERVGAPIARPHRILCIGLNYADHTVETGEPRPGWA